MLFRVMVFPNGDRDLLKKSPCCFKASWNEDELSISANETGTIVLYDGMEITSCPYCDASIGFEEISDPLTLGNHLHFGSCDYCEEDERVIKHCYDNGIHVLNKCKFGCDSELSSTKWLDGILTFKASNVRRIHLGDMDSEWIFNFIDSDGKEGNLRVTRRNYETEESLLKEIARCNSYHQLDRLQLASKIYYD